MKFKRMISVVCILTLLSCSVFVFPSGVQAKALVLPTDVTKASAGCELVGIRGSYIVQAESAINRINELRREACNEGVLDPRDESRKLTPNDYTPIKWSSDLEYIARIRAAEAIVIMSHTRPNGDSCFSVESPNGIGSFGEILAWNFSKSMVDGINQWYEEKYDWVHQTGNVTGHYTQMIDPSNTYIGLGMFYSEYGAFPNCTSGEFCSYENLDTTPGKSVSDCIQTIEIEKSALGRLTLNNSKGTSKFSVNESVDYQAGYNVVSGYDTAYVTALENIEWQSSDSKVATVSNGTVKAIKPGTATITAKLSSGDFASTTVTVSKLNQNMTVKAKAKNIKASALRKKTQKLKNVFTVKSAQGSLAFKLVKSGITKKIRKLVKINSKGVITIKKWKKAKKGTYKIKVKITASGNAKYNSKTITKTVTIRVK